MTKKSIKIGLKIINIIIVSVFLIFSGIFLVQKAKVRNVFDEIYYVSDWPFALTQTKYGGEYLHAPRRDDYLDWPYLKINYKNGTYKNWDWHGYFILDNEEKKIDFSFTIILNRDPDFAVSCYFTYFIKEKKLLLEPVSFASVEKNNLTGSRFGKAEEEMRPYLEQYGVTKELLREMNDYFLYDIMIGGWIEDNGNRTKFTKQYPGKFKMENKRFEFLGNLRETEEE